MSESRTASRDIAQQPRMPDDVLLSVRNVSKTFSSKGVNVQYLDAPQDAVITMADASFIQSLASIWGQ